MNVALQTRIMEFCDWKSKMKEQKPKKICPGSWKGDILTL